MTRLPASTLPAAILFAFASAASAVPRPVPPEPVAVTTDTFESALKAARGGATITLAPGDYGPQRIADRKWSPPLTIDATAATITFALDKVDGLTIVGGQAVGKLNDGSYGIKASFSRNIVVDRYRCDMVRTCVVLGNSSDFVVTGVEVLRAQADGVDVAMSRRGLVQGVRCQGNAPSPGAHADCIQLWSRAGTPPTADIVVRDNSGVGLTQGVFAGTGTHDGLYDGGFDRLTITGNVFITDRTAVRTMDCRDCTVTGNIGRPLVGGRFTIQTGDKEKNSWGFLPGRFKGSASTAVEAALSARP